LTRTSGIVDIRKQSVLEEADELKPEERTVKVLNLTEELGLIKAGIEVFEDIKLLKPSGNFTYDQV
jgi:hypothetical protein